MVKTVNILTIFTLISSIALAQDFFNLNGVRGKDISRLFDKDLTTNFNASNVNEPLAFPYESWVVLDSITNITQFSYYVGNSGQTQGFTVRFLDNNKNQLGVLGTSSVGMYRQWRTHTVDFKGVMFIQFLCSDPGVQWDGINEVSYAGNTVAKSPNIYPNLSYKPLDLGVYAHGVNVIGDRITKVYNGDTIFNKVAKSVRFYWTGQDFDNYPQSYFGKLQDAPLNLGRYGYNHSGKLLQTFKRWDIKPMMTKSGGSIKWLDSNTAKNNFTYLGGTVAQSKKYVDPLEPENWQGLSSQYSKLIGLYGSKKYPVLAMNGDTISGQKTMDIFEWDNEPNRWWQVDYYHTPKQYYKAVSSIYKAGKAVDATAKIYAGALPGIDTVYWKAVFFTHYLEMGNVPFPADGFNFNMYLNNGTQQREGTVGVSPESYRILNVIQSLQGFFNKHFGKPVQWTEFGYAVDPGSPYDVPDRKTQADWTLRLKAVVQAVPFIERMYYYAFFEDGTTPFNSMGLVKDSSDWKTATPYPVAFALAQELYIERDGPWFSEIVRNGGDTGLWVTRKGNLLKLWHPKGQVNYSLPANSKVYKIKNNSWLPDSTVTNSVTVDGSMTWVETSNTPPPPTDCKTIKAIIKTEYRDSATNKLIRTATATIYLR